MFALQFNKARKAAALALVTLLASPAFAQATDPVGQIFDGVDLSTVVASVVAIGLIVMSIVMAFKGIDLGKRAVSKA